MPTTEENRRFYRGGSDRKAGEGLGDVPGIDDLTNVAINSDPAFSAPSVLEVNGVGEVTADDLGLGESKFGEVPLVSTGYEPVEPVELNSDSYTQFMSDWMPAAPQGAGNNEVVNFAKKFLGVPYAWGKASPSEGFDCSGFVQYVYQKMGVNLPRISADQARAGQRIDFSDLQPGDLVAIDNSSRNNGADHIGIYVGNGQVINAPHPGSSVRIDSLDAFAGGWGVRL